MSAIRFLFDEDVPEALVDALIQREPSIEVLYVGWDLTPPKRTSDQDLIKVAETGKLILVSHDKNTLPTHVADHLSAGYSTWGIVILRRGFSTWRYVDDLLLIWAASSAEEWRNRLEFIPWLPS